MYIYFGDKNLKRRGNKFILAFSNSLVTSVKLVLDLSWSWGKYWQVTRHGCSAAVVQVGFIVPVLVCEYMNVQIFVLIMPYNIHARISNESLNKSKGRNSNASIPCLILFNWKTCFLLVLMTCIKDWVKSVFLV